MIDAPQGHELFQMGGDAGLPHLAGCSRISAAGRFSLTGFISGVVASVEHARGGDRAPFTALNIILPICVNIAFSGANSAADTAFAKPARRARQASRGGQSDPPGLGPQTYRAPRPEASAPNVQAGAGSQIPR